MPRIDWLMPTLIAIKRNGIMRNASACRSSKDGIRARTSGALLSWFRLEALGAEVLGEETLGAWACAPIFSRRGDALRTRRRAGAFFVADRPFRLGFDAGFTPRLARKRLKID
jgi:hypothetical protein